MAASAQGHIILNTPMQDAINKMRLIQFFDTGITPESKALSPQGGIWFHNRHGVSFTSWGEKVNVALHALNPQSTQVDIDSECVLPTQIID